MNQNAKAGPDFYDDDEVFATYTRHRRSADSPNETLEKPVILELVRPISGLRVLDLGCGDAQISLTLLDNGAVSYVGVEGSHKMALLAAQTLQGMAGEVIEHPIEGWDYPIAAFDLVLARLSLHYIADLAPIFANVAQTLAPGGRLVFSVEHPVITSTSLGVYQAFSGRRGPTSSLERELLQGTGASAYHAHVRRSISAQASSF